MARRSSTGSWGPERSRSSFVLRFSDEAKKAIDSFDPPARIQAYADIQEFLERYQKSTGDDELKASKFNYKALKGRDFKAAKINEIYICQAKYRATLVVVIEGTTIWVVDCFKKTKQKKEIGRSVRIANRIIKDTSS